MSYQSSLYWWVLCDRCGKRHESYDDYEAWAEKDQADELADDSGWLVEGGNHLCEDCQPHGPDWDDEHEVCAEGRAELECEQCRPSTVAGR
jgi:hypothetical protein